MKIKSELRKMKVRNTFIKMVGEANLTWEEKIALRDAVRKIVDKEGVKKIIDRKGYVIMDFDRRPIGHIMSGVAGLTFNTIITDRDGVEHGTYRSLILFDDEVEFNTLKEIMGRISYVNFKASLRAYYNGKRREGVKGFERKPLNF